VWGGRGVTWAKSSFSLREVISASAASRRARSARSACVALSACCSFDLRSAGGCEAAPYLLDRPEVLRRGVGTWRTLHSRSCGGEWGRGGLFTRSDDGISC
jgi:hypothetical protein